MKVDHIIEGTTSCIKNKITSLAELQALMDSLCKNIIFLCNPSK